MRTFTRRSMEVLMKAAFRRGYMAGCDDQYQNVWNHQAERWEARWESDRINLLPEDEPDGQRVGCQTGRV